MAVQRRTISRGTMYSTSVRDLQTQLRDAGYDVGPVDGDFGIKTRKAVSAFQKDHELHPDGIVGGKTWDALSKFGDNQDHLDAMASSGAMVPQSKPSDVGMGEVADANPMGETAPADLQGSTAAPAAPSVPPTDNPMGTALSQQRTGGAQMVSMPNGGDLSAFVQPTTPPPVVGQEPGQPATPLTPGMGPGPESGSIPDSPEVQQALSNAAGARGKQFLTNAALLNALMTSGQGKDFLPTPQPGAQPGAQYGRSPFDAMSGFVPPQGQMTIPEGNPMRYPWSR